MNRGKYIIVETLSMGEYPILFPSFVDHIRMVGSLTVVSAGSFRVVGKAAKHDGGDINVWAGDKSVTLNLESRPEDAAIIKKILRPKFMF